jgi:hypothetical protein
MIAHESEVETSNMPTSMIKLDGTAGQTVHEAGIAAYLHSHLFPFPSNCLAVFT